MKLHYFNQDKADEDDILLRMCKEQGYVPDTCLLGGQTVWGAGLHGKDPCTGCHCDRLKCLGRPERNSITSKRV